MLCCIYCSLCVVLDGGVVLLIYSYSMTCDDMTAVVSDGGVSPILLTLFRETVLLC